MGLAFALARSCREMVEYEDFVGLNNLCYVRAPYQILTNRVLSRCLSYVQGVEHGWGEEVGPQGVKKLCSSLSGRSSRFEW